MMPFRLPMFLPLCAALMGAGAVSADTVKSPVVVELFTSQGCFSCPPAEAYLGRLAERPDVVALEFHVHYWDELVYGFAGKWKDRFSNPAYTARQRDYNLRIRKHGGVYTPQMVIGGRLETVGSHKEKIEKAIRQARDAPAPRVDVKLRSAGSGRLEATISGPAKRASVWLVTFIRSAKTEVRSGENKGKILTSRHVVVGVRKVGAWDGGAAPIDLGAVPRTPGHGCAVLVQDGSDGPISGAAYCPADSA